MLSLCQIDAAVRRVRYYNPDLELELLFLDETELDEDNVSKLAHIRSALVARIADIGEAIDAIQVPGPLTSFNSSQTSLNTIAGAGRGDLYCRTSHQQLQRPWRQAWTRP